MLRGLVALLAGAGVSVSVVPDSVKVEGPLPPADALASIQKQLPSVSACAPESLAKDVTVTLKVTVMSDGQVSRSSLSGGGVSSDPAANGRFSDCVTDAADTWKFPARKSAGVSEVRVGIALKK